MRAEFRDILRCTECRSGRIRLLADSTGLCETCGARFPSANGVLNTMLQPRRELLDELRGEEIEKRDRPRFPPGECIATPEIFWEDFQAIRQHVRLAPGALILDLGTGEGEFIARLAQEGLACIGVDLKVHNTALLSQMDLILADMNNLPFEDAAFDLIVSASAVHHSYDLAGTFREAARVLKPGGQFLLLNEPLKGLLKNNRRFERYRNPLIHERSYWLTTYLACARRVGLRPRLFFPQFIDTRLRASDLRFKRFRRLGRIAAALWKWRWFRAASLRIAFYPALILLGIPLIMLATKKPGNRELASGVKI
jgi:SAM-dependent methyltransferase